MIAFGLSTEGFNPALGGYLLQIWTSGLREEGELKREEGSKSYFSETA